MAINKMFVMLPLMYGARKLDSEDPEIIFMLRCSYLTIQVLTIIATVYMYYKAKKLNSGKDSEKILYVPAPASPFQDPNEPKKKFTQVVYGPHLVQSARSLIGSTLTGILFTGGLHIYRGVIAGLAMQSVMGPLNFLENPVTKLIFFGSDNPFDAKEESELDDDVEIVDGNGQPVELKKENNSIMEKPTEEKKTFEDILLDTWDEGEKADLSDVMAAVNKSNVNFQVKSDNHNWTALMIISGLGHGVKGVTSSMKQLKALGADPKIIDSEGWNALFWTAFHGNAEAAKVLLSETEKGGFDGVNLGLHLVKDKDGKTAVEHGKEEGNNDVVDVILAAVGTGSECKPEDADEGIRKRK